MKKVMIALLVLAHVSPAQSMQGPLNEALFDEIKRNPQEDLLLTESLLLAGANPNAVANNQTPLELALQKNNKGIAKLLIDYGADVNKPRGRFQSTLLHEAVSSDDAELCTFLLQNGADKNKANNVGETPIDRAVNRKREDVIQALLSQRKK